MSIAGGGFPEGQGPDPEDINQPTADYRETNVSVRVDGADLPLATRYRLVVPFENTEHTSLCGRTVNEHRGRRISSFVLEADARASKVEELLRLTTSSDEVRIVIHPLSITTQLEKIDVIREDGMGSVGGEAEGTEREPLMRVQLQTKEQDSDDELL
jgi:hypothetical protein